MCTLSLTPEEKVRTMAGTHEGRVLVFPQLTEALTPFEDKPQARKIVDADGGNLTLMELAAGQSWHEHHSVHPVFVQVLKGEVIFHVKDRDITLVPGKPIHVTAKLLHSLRAVKDSTLLVTMLTGESHPEPKVNIDVEEVINPASKPLTPNLSSPPHLHRMPRRAFSLSSCPHICR